MSANPVMQILWEWSRQCGLLPIANRVSRAKHWATNAGFRIWKDAICRRTSFEWNGARYRYAYNAYNYTWRNERSLEIPIILAQFKRFAGRRILEVGNVLSHYGVLGHDVLDKYDPAPGGIAADIADYTTPKPYDLLVSISTMEHVGWDETPRDPAKAPAAMAHLSSLMASGGEIWVTVPVGYHHALDEWLFSGRSEYQLCCFKRGPRLNLWVDAAPHII